MRMIAFLVSMLFAQVVYAKAANECTPWTKSAIAGLSLSANRAFALTRTSQSTSLGLLSILVRLVDANSSITRVRMTCTTSNDDNTTTHNLQACTTTAGACASDNAVWDRGDTVTGPGTANWLWRVDVEGTEDIECTFVASGTAAAIDTITVDWRECVKGGG